MIEFLVAIVAFVFVLGFIVTIHEFGHFYFAKKAGILCPEFAIGMGPVIYRVKKGETYYSIRALPIGGFVSMAGEDFTGELLREGMEISLQLDNNLITEIILDSRIEGAVKGVITNFDLQGKENKELFVELEVNGSVVKYDIFTECYYVLSQTNKVIVAPYDRCFESKTIMQRFLAIVAGPVMNLILAIFLFLIVGLATGVATNENVIGTVSTNTAQMYLEENDQITKIGDMVIANWEDIGVAMDIIEENGFEYIPMTVLRDGSLKNVEVKATVQINSIGITNINAEEYNGVGVLLGEIPSGNKAAEVGLSKNDILLGITIEGVYEEISSWADLMNVFSNLESGNVQFKYIRDGVEGDTKSIEIFTSDTLAKLKMETISYTIGISPTTQFSLLGGVKNGFLLTWSNATMIFTTLGMVLNPSAQLSVSDLSGPVGIFGLVQSYISAGVVTFISLMAMLSINFFVVNLLPLPALDGGRLVFLGYEAITKKPVDKKIENIFTMVGFSLLMIIMLYVTFNDLLRF